MKKIEKTDTDYWITALRKLYDNPVESTGSQLCWLSETAVVCLPDGFTLLSQEEKEKKFPTVNRPPIVYGNEDRSVVFTFRQLGNRSGGIEEQLVEAVEILRRADRRTVFYDTGEAMREEVKVVWREYKSFAMDGVVYNQVIFLMYRGKRWLLTFHCPFRADERWKRRIPEIVTSLSEEENEDERIYGQSETF